MSDLPSEYVELPYIESDGTQYIDTGYCPQYASISSLFFTLMDYPNANNNGVIFGIKDTANDTYTSVAITSGPDSNTTGSVTMNNSGNTLTWNGLINTSTNYKLMWYNDEMYIQNIKGGYQSYAGRPGQLFKDSEGIAITTNLNLYLLALNDNGTATNMFKGRIYRVQLTNTSRDTLIIDYIPCMRLSDKKLGLYDLITNTFVTNASGNDFTSGYSVPVNIRSFINLIIKRCTYTTGETLQDSHKTQLRNYLLGNNFSTQQTLLSVKDAINILKKFYSLVDYSNYFNTIDFDNVVNKDSKNALSFNTAKKLLDKVIPEGSEILTRFSSMIRLFEWSGGDASAPSYFERGFIKFIIPHDIYNSVNLTGKLYGGGGGGGGGAAIDGDKHSNYKWRSGAGASGNDSTINIITNGEKTQLALATGAVGGAAKTGGPTGGDPNGYAAGNDGVNGQVTSLNLDIPTNTVIQICIGAGGAGGGGGAYSCSNSNDYNNWALNDLGINGVNLKGGNGAERSTFTGDDHVAGGGGGAGGWGYFDDGSTESDILPTGPTAGGSNSSGPKHGGTVYAATTGEATFGNKARGGKGGYISGVGENTTKKVQEGGITGKNRYAGVGGKGGAAYNSVDTWTCANGGDGGNAGGLYVAYDSSNEFDIGNFLICGLLK